MDFNSVNVRNSCLQTPVLALCVGYTSSLLPPPFQHQTFLALYISSAMCWLYRERGEREQQLCSMMNVFDSYNYLWFQTIILQSGPLFYTAKCTRKATFHLFLSCFSSNISLSIKMGQTNLVFHLDSTDT